MTDFIHCNSCYALPDPNTPRKFFLTACGHLFCQRCGERNAGGDKCVVCGKKCNAVEINGQMDRNAQAMFSDPQALAKKHHRQMMDALSFQQAHRSRYVSFLHQQLKKARKLQEFASNETKKRQHFERENQALRAEVAQLKQQMMRSAAMQTPCETPTNPMNRYRPNNGVNTVMTATSLRTNVTTESNTLPLGIEAATYRQHHGQHNDLRRRGNIVSSPMPFASPQPFPQFNNVNMSRETVNPIGIGDRSPYAGWQNNISGITLGTGGSQEGYDRVHNNSGINVSRIAAAFRRVQ